MSTLALVLCSWSILAPGLEEETPESRASPDTTSEAVESDAPPARDVPDEGAPVEASDSTEPDDASGASSPPEPDPAPRPSEPPSLLDPSMLDAEEPAPIDERAPVSTRRADSRGSGELSPEQLEAAVQAAYAELYRPASNPTRFNATARLLFANISGPDGASGRMGGLSVDLGPAWNRFGVALTLRGWSGRVRLSPDTQLLAMVGGGPTLGLGRLALLGRGYVDFRLGYDVHYGRMLDGAARLPHGPRARMDLGLLLAGERRFFHGVGASIGYQRLLGSADGQLPGSNMLTIGVAYWLG